MIFLDFADYLSILELILDLASIYLAYRLTRVVGGAPRAWYVMISGFVVLFVYTGIQLIDDASTPANIIDTGTAIASLIAVAIFTIGLFMLLRTFQERLKLSGESSTFP